MKRCLIHKWRYDLVNCNPYPYYKFRTCIKCGEHQRWMGSGMMKIECLRYENDVNEARKNLESYRQNNCKNFKHQEMK